MIPSFDSTNIIMTLKDFKTTKEKREEGLSIFSKTTGSIGNY